MDEQVVKEFNDKLAMFEKSLSNISDNFIGKLDELGIKTKEVAENTIFLKRMKVIFDDQNRKLEIMDATLEEIQSRLDTISEGGVPKKSKKKKRRRG